MRQIRKISPVFSLAERIVGIDYPHKTALFHFVKFRIQFQIYRKYDLRSLPFNNLHCFFFFVVPGLFLMLPHDLFRLFCADSFERLFVGKFRLHTADQTGHLTIRIRHDLDRSAGYSRIRIHLLEHIIEIAGSIIERSPWFKLHPRISAKDSRHRVCHPFGILYIPHRTLAAGPFDKINTAVFCFADSRAAIIHPLDIFQRQLTFRRNLHTLRRSNRSGFCFRPGF